jgi:hypothetical protein
MKLLTPSLSLLFGPVAVSLCRSVILGCDVATHVVVVTIKGGGHCVVDKARSPSYM